MPAPTVRRRPRRCRERSGTTRRRASRARPAWRRIAEHHVVEVDPRRRPRLGERDGVGSIDDRGGEIEVLEDAGEQRPRGLQVERRAHNADEREQHPRLHRRERDDRAGRDVGRSSRDEPARHDVDDDGDRREEDLHEPEEDLSAHRLPHLEAHLALVLGGIAFDLAARPVERLGEEDAGDRQRLCVIAVISDRLSCVSPAIRARTWPTRRCAITSSGMSTTATIASCR